MTQITEINKNEMHEMHEMHEINEKNKMIKVSQEMQENQENQEKKSDHKIQTPNHLSKITGSYETTQHAQFSFIDFAEQTKAAGKYLILYFYPKDNTPGCTAQSLDLRNHFAALSERNVEIIGVSRDSMASHHRFAEKLGLPFALLSDPDEQLCTQFDVIKIKNMYGKKARGIQRSTFIFSPDAALAAAWLNVKANKHIEDVLQFFDINVDVD